MPGAIPAVVREGEAKSGAAGIDVLTAAILSTSRSGSAREAPKKSTCGPTGVTPVGINIQMALIIMIFDMVGVERGRYGVGLIEIADIAG